MGTLEFESRKRARKNEIRNAVLASVKVAGILSVALLAPKVLSAMKQFGLLPSPSRSDSIRRSCERLIRAKLLVSDSGKLRLTQKGESVLRTLEARNYAQQKPSRWDGKWRVLIFDIPEYRKSTREKIRRTVMEIGFIRLQDSVWIYPYDCEDLLTLLKADLKVGKDLLYMIVDSLEGDAKIRLFFGLKHH